MLTLPRSTGGRLQQVLTLVALAGAVIITIANLALALLEGVRVLFAPLFQLMQTTTPALEGGSQIVMVFHALCGALGAAVLGLLYWHRKAAWTAFGSLSE